MEILSVFDVLRSGGAPERASEFNEKLVLFKFSCHLGSHKNRFFMVFLLRGSLTMPSGALGLQNEWNYFVFLMFSKLKIFRLRRVKNRVFCF